jgi:phage protein D
MPSIDSFAMPSVGPVYGQPSYQLAINDVMLKGDYIQDLTQLEIEENIGGIDKLTFTMNAYDFETGKYRHIEDPLLDVGKSVDVWMGYAPTLVFMGRYDMLKSIPEFTETGVTIKIEAFDAGWQLLDENTGGVGKSEAAGSPPKKFKRSWTGKSDSDIMMEFALKYKMLPIITPVLPPPPPTKFKFQKNEMSDWHFCKKLAIANSRRFYIKYNPLIKKTEFHWEEDKVQDSVVVFKYNAGDATTLFNFKPDMSTQGLPTMIEIVYIDRTVPKAQAWKVTAKLSKTKGVVVGKPQIVKSGTWVDKNVPSGSEFKVQVMGEDKALFGLPMTIKNTMDVTTLAKAFFAKYQDWFIVASCKTVGIETLHKYQVHKFTGVTSRYDGAYKVYKVKHNYSNDAGYTLEMELNKLITKFDDLATPEALI